MPDEVRSPRSRCYHAVNNAASHATAAYYKRHPEKITDPCFEEMLKHSTEMVVAIMKALDGYEISDLSMEQLHEAAVAQATKEIEEQS